MELAMHRRTLIKLAGGLPLMSTTAHAQPYRRVRPGETGWPTAAQWKDLDARVGGRLVALERPTFDDALFRSLKNPWAIGDNPALTQTSGWVDAWASTPSAYAVPARGAADV